ncbi:MAG: methyltransferase [Oscillospiraceae bacterium]|nr:methyltransferase [Oscillospiraceae bacterium]
MIDFNDLRKDEINDNLALYQVKDGLLFGTDALMLADFICAESTGAYKTGIEFGAGSGVISLLLAAREKIRLIYALEIQEIYAELADYNASINKLENNIKIICADLKNHDSLYHNDKKILAHSADIIFTNPPYLRHAPAVGRGGNGQDLHGKLSPRNYKNIARREIACDIFDILKSAARLIKNGGDFYIVYRPDRLQSLFAAMTANNITPKKIKFIFAAADKSASLVLIKGRQGAGEGLTAENIFV